LPAGLALKNFEENIETSGVLFPTISGTPTQAGTFTITLTASNEDGKDTATLTLTVSPKTVDAPPTINSAFATPNPAITGQRVTFSATAVDPENAVPTYTWDFKDGSTDSGATVNHTFTTAGTYAVAVSVSDGTNTVTRTISLTVSAPTTQDPVIDSVTADINPAAPNTQVTFTANASSPAGEALTYSWIFGDNTALTAGNPAKHSYSAKGQYTVTLTVSDVSKRSVNFNNFTMFVTDATDPQNLDTGKIITSPDGMQITVLPAPPGVVALDLSVTTSRGVDVRDAYDFDTEFYLPAAWRRNALWAAAPTDA